MKKFLLNNYIHITNIVLMLLLVFLVSIFRPTVVHGESMCPTLKEGDTLLCNTYNVNPQIGDIVVVKPFIAVNEKYIIKRVVDIQDNKIFIQGDNTENSFDSRNFGWIDMDQVLGIIIQ